MKGKTWFFTGTALFVGLVAVAIVTRVGFSDYGSSRLFQDQNFHFQTLRALNDIPFHGADTAEVFETVRHIKSGDVQGWFAAWERTAARVEAQATKIADPISKGRAYLRAHNYYRTAEFFLPPEDPMRPAVWAKNIGSFYKGLDTLGVTYQKIKVPYGAHYLNAVYYPGPAGANDKPLIVFHGGFDSTLEELYFVLVAAARERGYSVLTFEGPGQGAIIREQGLPFTYEWEKPTSAVLNVFLKGRAKPTRIILVGMSLGGYLAPRAAAFDRRIDGVVAFDVFFDGGEIAQRYVPAAVRWLHQQGFDSIVNAIVGIKAALQPGFRWAVAHGQWVMGTKNALETVDKFASYNLRDTASRITADVLILAGADDHFVPLHQVAEFEKALVNARSVTTKIYNRESGGAEHCQLGAITLWHSDFFDWMIEKFGPG